MATESMTEEEFKKKLWDSYVEPIWDDIRYYQKLDRDLAAAYNRRVVIMSNALAFLCVVCIFPFILMQCWYRKAVRFFKTEF